MDPAYFILDIGGSTVFEVKVPKKLAKFGFTNYLACPRC